MADQNKLEELAGKWLKGTITPAEKEVFNNWFHEAPELPVEIPESAASFEEEHELKLWKNVHAKIEAEQKHTKRLNRTIWSAAASLILVSCLAWYFIGGNIRKPAEPVLSALIKPGGDKAFLTLANGKRMVLSDLKNGILATENGVQVSKTEDGLLRYAYTDTEATGLAQVTSVQHSIEVPKGGEYQVILADGTKIWLNSASKLGFPANFSLAKNRNVQLEGEAYFEVAKEKEHPFRVKSSTQEVEVLGTHFNVRDYPDEQTVKTSLLEGSIRLSLPNDAKVLVPGQESQVKAGQLTINTVNAADAVAWKDGRFVFKDEKLVDMMRSIGRWYDVEIVFENKAAAEKTFSGGMSRSDDLGDLLRKLQKTEEIKFRLEGRKITVL